MEIETEMKEMEVGDTADNRVVDVNTGECATSLVSDDSRRLM